MVGVRRRRWIDRICQQRPVPFLAAIASFLAGLALLVALGAPRQLVALVVGGFVVAFFGAALLAGNTWAEVFVWPTLAGVAPDVVVGQSAEASSLTAGIALSAPLFGIGIVLFGLATLKAALYPRWAAGLLIVSIPVTIFLPPTEGTLSESIGQIMLGSAFMILGWYARRIRVPTP